MPKIFNIQEINRKNYICSILPEKNRTLTVFSLWSKKSQFRFMWNDGISQVGK
jgi:hypothetical protein